MNPVPSPNRRLPAVLALLLIAAAVLWSLRLLGVTWILPNASERVSPSGALAALGVPQGFQAKLYAGDPLLRNPVAMCLDGRGAILVVETSCPIPPTMLYSDDELACRTWEEAEALRRKEEPSPSPRSERLIRLEDRSGAGVADRRQVLYEGFSPSDGIAAGVLEHEGRVWLANCPKLYLMTPTGEGVAAPPKPLLHGFGCRRATIGHDLHGLILGPDGKLYFSIGDRGLHVETPDGKVIDAPDTGAVLRCEPDGSDLELVAQGLRNPQRLAFDDAGNLWTADNDANDGDRPRLLHVVEGADYGWRIGYQILPSMGPWNAEKLWAPESAAAYALPPSGLFGRGGPSGLVCNPGTGMPEKYAGCFFVGLFPVGVQTFKVLPRGAGFEMTELQNFCHPANPSDLASGPGGELFILDWGSPSTELPGGGLLFRIDHPETAGQKLSQETRRLLLTGLERETDERLAELLGHADRRVRQSAQFALVKREAVEILARRAAGGTSRIARVHAVWGLGQTGGRHPAVLERLLPLLSDGDDEIRAQAANVLGARRHAAALNGLIVLLRDASPRPRFFAAQALARLGRPEGVEPVVAMLRENADRDPVLRHAGVLALAAAGGAERLVRLRDDADAPVRLAAVLALRRQRRPEIAAFLQDPDPRLVTEAARAIHDVPIPEALPALASRVRSGAMPVGVSARAVDANFRLQTREAAAALAALAASETASTGDRLLALRALEEWPKPTKKDRVTGQWSPLAAGNAAVAADALRPHVDRLLAAASPAVRLSALRAAIANQVWPKASEFIAFLRDSRTDPAARAGTLRLLGDSRGEFLGTVVVAVLEEKAPELEREAVRLIARARLPDGLERLKKYLGSDQRLPVRQAAVASLAEWPGPESEALLLGLTEAAVRGDEPLGLQLDLLEAARFRATARLKGAGERLLPPGGPTMWKGLTEGGDADAGRQVFQSDLRAACVKCHKVGGSGGEVGPPLDGVGSRLDRRALLESLLLPNAVIAPGFEQELLLLKDGSVLVGRRESETATHLALLLPDGRRRTVPLRDVTSRRRALSAMPEGLEKQLQLRDLRNLVEFLASLR